jgi:hypothetical protein
MLFSVRGFSQLPPPTASDEARLARVVPHVDRGYRIAAMLDRWKGEDVGDEPDWKAEEITPLAVRLPFP